MTRELKRLDLFLREVKDPYAQENFWRLRDIINDIAKAGFTGPAGPPGPAGTGGEFSTYAGSLKVSRIASEDIVKGDALYATSATHVGLATAASTVDKALVFGFAINDALINAGVDVLILGVLTDPSFSIFTLNSPLFLDESGGVTDTKRVSGYHVITAKSLGSSQIFVNIREPIIIA